MSHAIIDGIIDIPRTKQWVLPYEDAKLSPDSVSLKIDLTCFNCILIGLDCGLVLAFAYSATDYLCVRVGFEALY